MTDIYVSQERSRRGCLVSLLLAVLVVVVAGWLLKGCFFSEPAHETDERVETTDGDVAAAPTPTQVDAATWADRLARAGKGLESDALQQTRAEILNWMEQFPPPLPRMKLETILGEIHTKLILTPAPMKEKRDHVIQRGDTLGDLAREAGTTVELIKTSNQIKRDIIRIGDRLRIFSGTFNVKVDKSDNVLEVFLDGKFFKRYQVGTGKYNRTPVGTYKITLRQERPTWYRPDGAEVQYGDPENLLGTHYLKLDTPGIGLHGTWEEETIGSQSSAGCVRLKNSDIEQLYIILPVGTSVEIMD